MQKDASFAQQTKGEESVHAESSPCIHTVKLHASPLVRGVYIFLSILYLILAVLGIVLLGVPSFFYFSPPFLQPEALQDYIDGCLKIAMSICYWCNIREGLKDFPLTQMHADF